MKQTWERFNRRVGVFSGGLILVIGLLAVLEGVMRGIFSAPTSWSADVSRYILIWAIFLGSAFTFQEKGHVAVDFIREMIGKRWGNASKIVAVIGYLLAVVYVLALIWGTVDMIIDGLETNKLTLASVQIPAVYLYLAMLIGSLFMLVSLYFIIADLIKGGKDYL